MAIGQAPPTVRSGRAPERRTRIDTEQAIFTSADFTPWREPDDLFTRRLSDTEKFQAPTFQHLPDGTKIVFSNGIPSAIPPE